MLWTGNFSVFSCTIHCKWNSSVHFHYRLNEFYIKKIYKIDVWNLQICFERQKNCRYLGKPCSWRKLVSSLFFQIKACHHLSKALFVSLSRQNEELLAQIIEHLQVLANSDIGLPMVLRCLLTGKNWYFMKSISIKYPLYFSGCTCFDGHIFSSWA